MAGRRLTAILAADIAGYSALMGENDLETLAELKARQSAALPLIAGYSGRVIDTAGDGILAEFPSVFNAVKCALAIQEVMRERNASVAPEQRMHFRIGINQGDVLFDENRIYGDGINIAARLEGLCEPGCICISAKVYEEVKGRLEIEYQDIGEQKLHNIASPVRAFRISLSGAPATRKHPTKVARTRGWAPTAAAVTAVLAATAASWEVTQFVQFKAPNDPLPTADTPGKQSGSRSRGLEHDGDAGLSAAGASAPAVSCPAGQPGSIGRCKYTIASEDTIRAQAAREGIPLPATIAFSGTDSGVPAGTAAYVGAWGGDARWNGVGRQILLIVERVSSSGEVYGIYGEGPPNPQTSNQNPAGYTGFIGSITQDGLTFIGWSAWKYTFLRGEDDSMMGYLRGPHGLVSAITIRRF